MAVVPLSRRSGCSTVKVYKPLGPGWLQTPIKIRLSPGFSRDGHGSPRLVPECWSGCHLA